MYFIKIPRAANNVLKGHEDHAFFTKASSGSDVSIFSGYKYKFKDDIIYAALSEYALIL